jgi:hypothetical protein
VKESQLILAAANATADWLLLTKAEAAKHDRAHAYPTSLEYVLLVMAMRDD